MAPTIYAGALGRLDIGRVAELGPRFAVQPKHDGQYVRIFLDGAGRIAGAAARSGREVPRRQLGALIGAFCGWPLAELVGELTAHTEAGVREAAIAGHRQVHLFDCLHDGTRRITAEPYRTRRDALYRMQSEACALAGPLPWRPVAGRRARHKRSGRYAAAVPTDYRLTPIVPQVAVSGAPELWDRVRAGQLEGLVVVALDAPMGRRGAKRKVKITDEREATVLALGPRDVTLLWAGGVFAVGRPHRINLRVGSVVSFAHNNFYESGSTPRFARITRVRDDLQE